MTGSVAAHRHTGVDGVAMGEALRIAADRVGRLSDEDVRALKRRRRAVLTAPALACAVAVMTVGLYRGGRAVPPPTPAPQEFATRAGERGTARLADGSTLWMNGSTRVRVALSDRGRTVELVAGQAYFDVAHDPARPFVVRAGIGQARVLGTAFDLDLTGRQLALAVHRGAVGFGTGSRAVVVRAGYRSRLRNGRVEKPTGFDASVPDWRQGWIDTDGMRLDELVDVLGRGGGARIARPSGALANVTVAGRFRTDRPGELLRAIGAGFGFRVVERDGVLVLVPA